MSPAYATIVRARLNAQIEEMQDDGGPCRCPQATAALELCAMAIGALRAREYGLTETYTTEELDGFLFKIAGVE